MMKTTRSIIAGAVLSFATVGAAYADGGGHNPAQVFPNPPSDSPRVTMPAQDNHHNDGGQNRDGRDWSKNVIPDSHQHPADTPSSPSFQKRGWNSK
ncbi:MAG: hypothetical protein RKO66_11515 [Candidatus Contendobacter sp.]|nr:hypothetical protein [Candidatus Contendobacter sp.]